MNRTTQYLIISLAALLVCVGAFAYLDWRIVQNGAALVASMQQVADTQATERMIDATTKELEETAATRADLERLILAGDNDTVEFLSLIETTAREQGVVLTTDSLQVDETDNKQYNTLRLALSLEGSGTSVERMIQMLENLPYEGRLQELRIQEDGSQSTAKVTLTMSIVADSI